MERPGEIQEEVGLPEGFELRYFKNRQIHRFTLWEGNDVVYFAHTATEAVIVATKRLF